MKKSLLFLTGCLIWASLPVIAQVSGSGSGNAHHSYCGTTEYTQQMRQQHGYNAAHAAEDAAYEEEIQREMLRLSSERGDRQTVYVIPIVFHIVHENGIENISDAQVHDAIRIMNEDFNKNNSDTSQVVPSFTNLVGDAGIEFRLAQKDALGNCVSGITRTYSTLTNSGNNAMVDAVNANLNGAGNTNNVRYPRNMYLNIWVCKNPNGAAGYTRLPSNFTAAKYDGIWISHSYVGSMGTGSSVRSRALTHEVGHWLNLNHVWGGTNNPGVSCGDDGVSDTPITKGWTICNLTGAECNPSIIENVQNFMEYSYCSKMFTIGQATRMRAAVINSTGQRNNLWTSGNLDLTGTNGTNTLCAANFNASRTVICAGESVNFNDLSFHGPTGWSWTFTGGSPASSTTQNPTGITYSTPGTYNVSLSVTNPGGSESLTLNQYITVLPATGSPVPIVEGFEATTSLPSADWHITNPNSGQSWEVVTGTAYTGSKSVKINNISNSTPAVYDLISSPYDLTSLSSVEIHFKYAYAQRNSSSSDRLRVYVSNDCGQTWSLRRSLAGSALSTASSTTSPFTPSSTAQWANFTVNNIISSYLVDNFMVKFSFESEGGNNIYIDDINITGAGASNVKELEDPYQFILYPNPVEQFATLSFTLPEKKSVRIDVLDVLGKVVYSTEKGQLGSGAHTQQLDCSAFVSGIYFVRLESEGQVFTRKMIVR